MSKAKRLASGQYRVQYYIDGVRMSITRETAREAEFAALEHKLGHKHKTSPSTMTVADAIDTYIESKSNILSPSTVRGYKIIQRHAFNEIDNIKISRLTSREVQLQINTNSAKYSAKSISNQHGLLVSALKPYGITFDNIALKPREKRFYNIPTPAQISQIVELLKGTKIECWILCAIMLGLRQSEIAGLKWENYTGKQILVSGAIIINADNVLVEKKANKSAASTRLLDVPTYLQGKLNSLPRTSPHIFAITAASAYTAFVRLMKNNGLPAFTVHNLRHAHASMMLLSGVPNKYAMERMGHSTDNMLKAVYQHTFKSEQDLISEKMDNYFATLVSAGTEKPKA